jgi:hypothetical protein
LTIRFLRRNRFVVTLSFWVSPRMELTERREVIEFEWTRCLDRDGWVIVPPRSRSRVWPRRKGAPVRTVPAPTDASLSTAGKRYFETYSPTEFSALFRIFADKPATAEGMRDFFNTFGPLDWGSDRFGPFEPTAGWCSVQTSLGKVLRHHTALCRAVDLFEAGNLSALSEGFDRGGWGRLHTKLRPGSRGKAAIVWVPYSLIQFLWLQLALCAASDAKLFRCRQCGHPFLVGSTTGRRSKAKYCSDRCRLAAFRRRHSGRTANA